MLYDIKEDEIKQLRVIYSNDYPLSNTHIKKFERKEAKISESIYKILGMCEEVAPGRFLLPKNLKSVTAMEQSILLSSLGMTPCFNRKEEFLEEILEENPSSKLEKFDCKKKYSFSNFSVSDEKVARWNKHCRSISKKLLSNESDVYISYRPYDIITMSHGHYDSCYGAYRQKCESPWVLTQSPYLGLVFSVSKGACPVTARKETRFFFFDNGENYLHLGRNYGSFVSRYAFLSLLEKAGLTFSSEAEELDKYCESFYSSELTYYRDCQNQTVQNGVVINKAAPKWKKYMNLAYFAKMGEEADGEDFSEFKYHCPACEKAIVFSTDFSNNGHTLTCCLEGICFECGGERGCCECEEEY